MRFLVTLFLLISNLAHADVIVTIENSMMTSYSPSAGGIDLGTFDPFDPAFNCNSFISPNTCTVNGRDLVDINLVFNYSVVVTSGSGSADLSFSVNNGMGGTTGQFTNVSLPSPIFNIMNQGVGVADVSFSIPLFGPQSQINYGMDIILDVTINP